jgi:2-keto-3-deoxy-L-rhamnonate aldolase RhmA
MIEDPEALPVIDDILAVDGLDAVFIGRGDLTVAFGAHTRDDPRIIAAIDEILRAAHDAGKSAWMMVETAEEARDFAARGASTFIISSDQGFLRKACIQAATGFSKIVKKAV